MKRTLRQGLAVLMLGMASCSLTGIHAQSVVAPTTGDGICQLGTLDLTTVTYFDDSGKTAVRADKNTLGGALVIKGTTYESGVGTHADSKFVVKVNGATKFHAVLGIDDGADNKADHGIVNYTLTTYDSDRKQSVKAQGTITRSEANAATVDVDLTDCVLPGHQLRQGRTGLGRPCGPGQCLFHLLGHGTRTHPGERHVGRCLDHGQYPRGR